MKAILLTFLLLFSGVTAKADIGDSETIIKIESVIKHLSPHLKDKEALNYAIIIEKYSTQYRIDWKVPVVIFKQESDYVLDKANYKTYDLGIGQLNWHWHIRKKQINIRKLLTDADYSIHETFKILDNLNRKYNTKSHGWMQWFTRYHSFRPSLRKQYYHRDLYRWFVKVEKYLNGPEYQAIERERRERSSKKVVSTGSHRNGNSNNNRSVSAIDISMVQRGKLGRRERAVQL